jgi:hypothetical protein
MLAYPFGQAKAINGAGHFDIAENNIHDDLSMQEHRHRFVCTYRLNDFIAAVPQVLCDGYSHQNVILNNKDRFLNCGRIGHMQ